VRRRGTAVTGRGTARQGSRRRAGGARPADGGGIMAERPEEEDEGRGPHVSEGEEGGRPGGSANWWAGAGRGEVEAAGERRGKGGRRGWLGQRPSGPVRLARSKARNE
jgi:hypothetical protein